LNLKGREPQGRLAPGDEAERFCAELARQLLDITRPGSSTPLVRRVHRSADLFSGPRLSLLPDLLVEWAPDPPMGTAAAGRDDGAVWAAYSPAIGLIEKRNHYCRTGEHRAGGLLMVAGDGIEPGRLERTLSVLDLAPTFARLLGCEMPGAAGAPI